LHVLRLRIVTQMAVGTRTPHDDTIAAEEVAFKIWPKQLPDTL
jgi:hypothetical protein